VFSIHRVARGLGASFLYKCHASRGGFLRQHDLLLTFLLLRQDDGSYAHFRSGKQLVNANPSMKIIITPKRGVVGVT